MTTPKTLQSLVIICSLLFSSLCPAAVARGQSANQKIRIDRRTIAPNRPVPELYADKLSLKITLMNLPGAAAVTSHWEIEFRVYFVEEQDFERTVRQMNKAGRGRELRPEHFQSKILLAEGKYSKQKLPTLKERAFLRQGIDFRQKVPREQQTSFASIMSFYSVKIFDAKLKKDIYGSDVFTVPPFETLDNDRDSFSPRTDLFLNFFVAQDGSLYRSNTKSASETTEWKPN
jgi:hypothetical protein